MQFWSQIPFALRSQGREKAIEIYFLCYFILFYSFLWGRSAFWGLLFVYLRRAEWGGMLRWRGRNPRVKNPGAKLTLSWDGIWASLGCIGQQGEEFLAWFACATISEVLSGPSSGSAERTWRFLIVVRQENSCHLGDVTAFTRAFYLSPKCKFIPNFNSEWAASSERLRKGWLINIPQR